MLKKTSAEVESSDITLHDDSNQHINAETLAGLLLVSVLVHFALCMSLNQFKLLSPHSILTFYPLKIKLQLEMQ